VLDLSLTSRVSPANPPNARRSPAHFPVFAPAQRSPNDSPQRDRPDEAGQDRGPAQALAPSLSTTPARRPPFTRSLSPLSPTSPQRSMIRRPSIVEFASRTPLGANGITEHAIESGDLPGTLLLKMKKMKTPDDV